MNVEPFAYHEAGHVAVACALRVSIRWVELNPRVIRHRPFAGTTMLAPLNRAAPLARLRIQLKRRVVVLLAGELRNVATTHGARATGMPRRSPRGAHDRPRIAHE